MEARKAYNLTILLLGFSLLPCFNCNGNGFLLVQTLLKEYSTHLPPVPGSPVNCTVDIKLNQILQVHEKEQALTLNFNLRVEWEDVNLVWKPIDFGSISSIHLPLTSIWWPDIQLFNSAASNHDFKQSMESGSARIYHTGNVIYVIGLIATVTCSIDVTWFPFDQQNCAIHLGSWIYNGEEVALHNSFGVNLDNMVENGEWRLISAEAKVLEILYPCCPKPYHTADFRFLIQRRSFYYFFSLIFPCALIGFLAVLGFTLPPHSQEKLILGVTVLFSLIAFLNGITTTMPANSHRIPLLGTYFCCVMVTIALSVVSTIIVNLNERRLGQNLPELNGRFRGVVINWLPGLVGISGTGCNSNHGKRNVRRISNFANGAEEPQEPEVEFKADKSQAEIREEWKVVAMVVDRICFLISLLFSTVAVGVLAYNYTQ